METIIYLKKQGDLVSNFLLLQTYNKKEFNVLPNYVICYFSLLFILLTCFDKKYSNEKAAGWINLLLNMFIVAERIIADVKNAFYAVGGQK